MKRRNFIRSGALALAGFTILPRHILGGTNFVAPSDQINLGIIGCGAVGATTAYTLVKSGLFSELVLLAVRI